MNKIFAAASFTIAAKSVGVDDGASGATATPARNAPRNTAAYSIEDSAQIEIASRGLRPLACNDAAIRSISTSKAA